MSLLGGIALGDVLWRDGRPGDTIGSPHSARGRLLWPRLGWLRESLALASIPATNPGRDLRADPQNANFCRGAVDLLLCGTRRRPGGRLTLYLLV